MCSNAPLSLYSLIKDNTSFGILTGNFKPLPTTHSETYYFTNLVVKNEKKDAMKLVTSYAQIQVYAVIVWRLS